MRKWTYLVAALLMAGATTTFTGCIDNDEPTGITDLRGAKAELIRANAAYKLAEAEIQKVKIEREKVYLEWDKVTLEMNKLTLAKEQAQNAYDIARIEQQQAEMLEDYKARLFQYQAASAKWEAEYLKALAELRVAQATVTDKAFATALGTLITDLESERSNIKGLNNDLFDLTQNLVAFSSGQYDAIKGTAERDLKNKESKLVNQNAILEEVKSLKVDYGTEAINAQILELDKKIAKIDEEVAAKKADLIKVVGSATENEQLYSKQEVALETADKVITFEVPTAIQAKFISDFIKGTPDYASLKALVPTTNWATFDANTVQKDGEWTFKANPAINGLQLGTVTAYNEVATSTLLSTNVTALAKDVKIAGVKSYASAYEYVNTTFRYGLGSLSKPVMTIEELTADDLAKGANALTQVGKDVTTAQTTYDADVKNFEAKVKAYQTAADAYGVDLQLTNQEVIIKKAWDEYIGANGAYNAALAANPAVNAKKQAYDIAKAAYAAKLADENATQKDVATAKKAMDDAEKEYTDAAKALAKPAADLTAAITNLKTKLIAYYPLRKALCGDTDDFVATVAGVNEGKEFKIADKISTLTEEQFKSVLALGTAPVYGNSYMGYDFTSTKDGALQAWLKASVSLYGTSRGQINTAEKIVLDLATIKPNTDVSVTPIVMGSAKTLVTLKDAKDAFANINSWNTLATTIEGIATASSTKEAPIVAEIKKLADAINAMYEPYRDTFYALCALDADMYTNADLATVKAKLNITSAPNTEGEKQTLGKLKAALQNHNNGNSVTIYYPVYTDAELAEGTAITSIPLTETDLNKAIDQLEKNIGFLEQYIGAKKDEIKKLEDGTLKIDKFIAKEKVKVENEIAFKEVQIKNAQERFDALNKAKDALIKEFAGTDK